MKTITIIRRNGDVYNCLVDDCDYDELIKYNWHMHTSGYVQRKIWANKKVVGVYMHRQILCLSDGNIECDHIDHNRCNNQRSNLRICTTQQNRFNNSPIGKSSKYKGVHLNVLKCNKNNGKQYVYYYWRAKIKINGIEKTIGNFKTEEQAALEYNKKALELFGEFAYLNKVVQNI
jgi:hypothetical protein